MPDASVLRAKKKKRNKYGNVKTTVGGEKFDSRREALRYVVLKQRERDGEIQSLERQVVFILAPKVRIMGEKRARPAMKFTADFRYFNIALGLFVVEDTKGYADTAFRIRQHLMKYVHGIDVRLS